ncbi:hypothetical protein [Flavisphingopyxis soli]|nr:hypothetical protein [Sphingorhabdus soli]
MTDTDQKEMDEVLKRMLATPPTPHKAKDRPPPQTEPKKPA